MKVTGLASVDCQYIDVYHPWVVLATATPHFVAENLGESQTSNSRSFLNSLDDAFSFEWPNSVLGCLKSLELIVFETLFLVLARALRWLGLLCESSVQRIGSRSSVPVFTSLNRLQAHSTLLSSNYIRGPSMFAAANEHHWLRACLDSLFVHHAGCCLCVMPASPTSVPSANPHTRRMS